MLRTMKKTILLLLSVLAVALISCQDKFLEAKPDKALLVPATPDDFQALMDDAFTMNTMPGLSIISDGDYSISDAGWKAFSVPYVTNSYIWAEQIYEGQGVTDWSMPYQQVFNANIVLEGLGKLDRGAVGDQRYNELKGSALFYRALAFFNIAQTFAAPYDKSTLAATPGIPVRLSSDINSPSSGGTLQETYQQIEHDLLAAMPLLPDRARPANRPSKQAARAFFARMYLAMEEYDKAERYADSCLKVQNSLLDYNNLDTNSTRPFPAVFSGDNPEVIYYLVLRGNSFTVSSLATVEPLLYDLYQAGDLRKKLFFRDRGSGIYTFKGSYNGANTIAGTLFGGFATDELYLIRAECYARRGEKELAEKDLNTLLSMRFKSENFAPVHTADAGSALERVMLERRKELIERGLRWYDLRRLNKDPRFAVTLRRVVDGTTYTLPPNSARYTFPFPDDEIKAGGF
ncbi:hypothetical protein DDR33_07340 [Pararcticibacter amylolyticus]|uniref:RagB/SusD family nutrient uptake outer membrane protein n=2 Tax=Pararcticibacter amylolyticus TaxID=2173175 RepID=A0A2U2PIG3_9SPHI|nr:hypothetical protein DDR33_07340 [Pararcticibacter amylolyticus]